MTEQHRPEPTGQGPDDRPVADDGTAASPSAPEQAPGAPGHGRSHGEQSTEQFAARTPEGASPGAHTTGAPTTGAPPTGWPPPWATDRQQTAQHPSGQHPSGPHPTAQFPSAPQPVPPHAAYGQAGGPQPVFGPPAHDVAGSAAYPPPTRPRRTGRLRVGVAGLVAGALIGGSAGAGTVLLLDQESGVAGPTASAQPVVIENPELATSATAAAAKASPSVVTLYVRSGSAAGSGSGVVLTEDGYVLTNNHVVSGDGSGGGNAGGNAQIQVRAADGTLYDAAVVGTEPSADLAVVKLEGASALTPATFADSDRVQVGDLAVAIGSPLGLDSTVTDGIISATKRAVATGSTQNDATVIDALQTDAAINPGNSGGALVNAAGEVIGINTAIATVPSGLPGGGGQSGNIGVGFAIPSNTAERIATEIIETGQASQALLGVSARTEGDSSNSGVGIGARIVAVEPGSAAADAGLQPGDVITSVGDRLVTTSTELTAAIRSRTPGEQIQLTVLRGGDTTSVDVTLGSAD